MRASPCLVLLAMTVRASAGAYVLGAAYALVLSHRLLLRVALERRRLRLVTCDEQTRKEQCCDSNKPAPSQ